MAYILLAISKALGCFWFLLGDSSDIDFDFLALLESKVDVLSKLFVQFTLASTYPFAYTWFLSF